MDSSANKVFVPDPITCLSYEQTIIQDALKGHPGNEIVNFAENNDIYLIVMGTPGKTGTDRFLMGSVAEKVVRKSKVPVLVVRSKEQN